MLVTSFPPISRNPYEWPVLREVELEQGGSANLEIEVGG